MPEIESKPVTWKSFKSLPQLAFITWVMVFIIDAIFIAPAKRTDEYTKLLWLWVIGLILAFVLECFRIYRKRKTKPEEGDRLFIPLNALIIFFYASAYNGFTKEVGTWGDIDKTLNEHNGSFFGVLHSFAVPALANQTAYWPDVKTIAEKNELRKAFDSTSVRLTESLIKLKSIDDHNTKMQGVIQHQSQRIQALEQQLQNNPTDQMAGIKNDNIALKERNAQLENYIQTLTARINEHNALQQRYTDAMNSPNSKKNLTISARMIQETLGNKFYQEYFQMPISTSH